MKKRIFFAFFGALFLLAAHAQTEKKGGFKPDHLFTGGSVALGLGNGTTSFGIGPFFGYSLNKYIDVAASLNYDYVSQRQYDYDNYLGKVRQNVIGPGAFVRVFPVRFLYAQAQYEYNFITLKFLPSADASAGGYLPYKETHDVTSFLIGAGLATGRDQENKSYGYISVLFDVANNVNSPYKDGYGNANPIIRAGYNIALFQERKSRNNRDRYRRRRL